MTGGCFWSCRVSVWLGEMETMALYECLEVTMEKLTMGFYFLFVQGVYVFLCECVFLCKCIWVCAWKPEVDILLCLPQTLLTWLVALWPTEAWEVSQHKPAARLSESQIGGREEWTAGYATTNTLCDDIKLTSPGEQPWHLKAVSWWLGSSGGCLLLKLLRWPE